MMKRPTTALHEKSYSADMKTWCRYNIEQSKVDNLQEFMRSFMRQEKGKMSPQNIIDAWNEKQSEYNVDQFRKVVDQHIANVHAPFYEKIVSDIYIDKLD